MMSLTPAYSLLLVVGVAALIPLTAGLQSSTQSFFSPQPEGVVAGKWSCSGVLGVYHVQAQAQDGNPSQVRLQLKNLMPGNADYWTWGSGWMQCPVPLLPSSSCLVNLNVTLFSTEDIVTTVSGELVNAGAPQISSVLFVWHTNATYGPPPPPAFCNGSTWSKYGSDVQCLTDSVAPGTSLKDIAAYHVSRSRHDAPRSAPSRKKTLSSLPNVSNITKVHVVFTQHFDLGYTDYAWCVVSHYFWYIFPGTALTALELPGYVYTTHPWLLYFFFNCPALLTKVTPPPGIQFVCPTEELLSLVEQAIATVQIVWHAFPFDGFNELLGAEMFDYAFNFADWLEERFFPSRDQEVSTAAKTRGRQSGKLRSMQQVDVPGLYQVQLPTFLRRNLSALYVGQNPCHTFAGTIGILPNLFMWGLPSGDEGFLAQDHAAPLSNLEPLLVFTHKFGYGGLSAADAVIDARSQTALLVQCTLENHPPYTPQDIEAYLDRVASEFPDCNRSNVIASTYDDFAADVKAVGWPRDDLLLYDKDIGDAWVRVSASDPVKTKAFLAQRRAFESRVKSDSSVPYDNETLDNVLFSMTGCEHNWGLPWQTQWESAVYSYEEKRNMLQGSYPSTPPPPRTDSPAVSATLAEARDNPGSGGVTEYDCQLSSPLENTTEHTTIRVGFSTDSGALVRLDILAPGSNVTQQSLLDKEHPLFALLYAVHETTGPFPQQQSDGWGDPEPQLVDTVRRPELKFIVPLPSPLGTCIFLLSASINQSYYNNNTGTYWHNPADEQGDLMTVTTEVEFSLAAPPTQITAQALRVSASFNISGKWASDASGMYQSWNRVYSYGDSLHLQMFPANVVPRTWRLDALGSRYSPYRFGPLGTCNYHIADHVSVNISATKGGRMSGVVVDLPDTPLVLFGWNNASWVTSVTSDGLCAVNDTTGVWVDVWNQWNANWVVGFPWSSPASSANTSEEPSSHTHGLLHPPAVSFLVHAVFF